MYQSNDALRPTFGQIGRKYYATVTAGCRMTVGTITQTTGDPISCGWAGITTGTDRTPINTHAATNGTSRIFISRNGDATPEMAFLGWGGRDDALATLPINDIDWYEMYWRLGGTNAINGIASGLAEEVGLLGGNLVGMTAQSLDLWKTNVGSYEFAGFDFGGHLIKANVSDANRTILRAYNESLLPGLVSITRVGSTILRFTFDGDAIALPASGTLTVNSLGVTPIANTPGTGFQDVEFDGDVTAGTSVTYDTGYFATTDLTAGSNYLAVTNFPIS